MIGRFPLFVPICGKKIQQRASMFHEAICFSQAIADCQVGSSKMFTFFRNTKISNAILWMLLAGRIVENERVYRGKRGVN